MDDLTVGIPDALADPVGVIVATISGAGPGTGVPQVEFRGLAGVPVPAAGLGVQPVPDGRERCRGGVRGPEIRFEVSCGQLRSDVILVDESAGDLFPVNPVPGEVDRLGRTGVCSSRGELAEGAVRPAWPVERNPCGRGRG